MTTSTPDLAFATDKTSKGRKREVLVQLATSDHRPILISLETILTPIENSTLPRWNYKKANWNLYAQLTDEYVSHINCKTNRTNKSYTDFSQALLKAAKQSIPRGARKNYIPNWSQHLEHLHSETIKARNLAEKSPTIENNIQLQAANATFRKEYLSTTRKSWHEKTEKLNVDRDGHKLWKIAKSLNQEENQASPIVIEADDKKHTGREAAQKFINHFSSVGNINTSEKRTKEVKEQIEKASKRSTSHSHGMTTNLTMKELDDSLKVLKPKQAPGSDKISNDMLIHAYP